MRKTYYFFIGFFLFFLCLDMIAVSSNETQTLEPTIQKASLLPSLETLPSFNHKESYVMDTLSWKQLGAIKFVKKAHKDYPEGVMFPLVNSALKAKSKKKIVMSGFIVPIDNTTYALSKNVFASCFFCGQAGPETIMGIKFKGGTPKLKTDQYVTLEGNFRINENDIEDWIYHIEDAVIVKGK